MGSWLKHSVRARERTYLLRAHDHFFRSAKKNNLFPTENLADSLRHRKPERGRKGDTLLHKCVPNLPQERSC